MTCTLSSCSTDTLRHPFAQEDTVTVAAVLLEQVFARGGAHISLTWSAAMVCSRRICEPGS